MYLEKPKRLMTEGVSSSDIYMRELLSGAEKIGLPSKALPKSKFLI
jgi:hypothetical protein